MTAGTPSPGTLRHRGTHGRPEWWRANAIASEARRCALEHRLLKTDRAGRQTRVRLELPYMHMQHGMGDEMCRPSVCTETTLRLRYSV